MEAWLGHPAVQGGLLPFAVSFAAAGALARTRWLALALLAGFAICATLVIGWSIESLSTTRKLALIGAGTSALCLAVEQERAVSIKLRATCVFALAAASPWMVSRLLGQKAAAAALAAGALAASYVALQCAGTLAISRDPVRGAASGVMLGAGAGTTAKLARPSTADAPSSAVGVAA